MLRKMTLCTTLLCGVLVLLAPVARSEEGLAFELIPQQTLLNYLAGTEKFTLIDARSAEEYEAGHIWGAVHVAHDSDLAASAVLPEDLAAPMVVYCKSGKRAAALHASLLARGYTDVRVLGPAQMLWADELPVFNCGASETTGTGLATVDSLDSNGGKLP